VIASLATCITLTRTQIATWRTTESLWQHAIAVDPENLFAQLRIGADLYEQRRLDDAKIHFSTALKLFPALEMAIYYLGDIHEIQGNEPLAIAYFEWLLRLRPNDQAAHQALARLYRKRPPGNRPQPSPQAIREVELGVAQGARITRQRNWAGALTHFERAIAIDPNCESALRFAGDALEELGRIDESKERFEGANRLNPLDVEARHAIDRLDWKKSKRN
jgi:tetratricopeptide (TPR) repeat protein